MDVRFLILTLFLLVSCMPTAEVGSSKQASTGKTPDSSDGAGKEVPATPVSWNYLGSNTDIITINVSNLNNAYLVGTPLESFLAESVNFSGANYCLVSSYSLGGIPYELRSRIVPISYWDFNLKKTVRNLRVDFDDITNSSAYCNSTLRVKNSTGEFVTDVTSPPTFKFDPSLICPTCTSVLTSTKVRLFKRVTQQSPGTDTTLDEVPLGQVNTTSLVMQIDPNYSNVNNPVSCSKTECMSRGYDCCLNNQCVRDGSVKPQAYTQYQSLLATVEQERIQNPLAYLNYPQLYYICGSTVPTTGGSNSGGGSTTGGSSGGGTPQDQDAQAFTLLKKDFQCINHIKSQATTNPFHNEILGRATPYTPATDCLTSSSDSGKEMFFQNVIKRLYTTCGCAKTDLQDMINSCPAYEYVATVKDSAGNPLSIDCYTPPGGPTTIPTNQTVSVNGRSAPHRFFDTNGLERELTSGAEQEGSSFSYMDEGKVLPVQQDFSMNAILGQMSVSLDKALPAKTVNVELDQVYFISTSSGYYTPCPSCAKDSWLNSFSAFPASSTGTGLQAIGHTTERDQLATNSTGGNYEDTIFGRACWLPPTMIPFSHKAATPVQNQRLQRLETQSALFNNGYQRDWFGFNKGALIGSFDGVSWFAIGKGRIVKSTSKKLFLAINAPFADVASPGLHVVRVNAYDGITQAAQVDYDPQYHQYHPYQNEAGNCQKYHMCETDTDCVTQLGWEYTCADVKALKTTWPEFDGNGNEIPGSSVETTIDQILAQKSFPTSSSKRCIYRGAGAFCNANTGNFSTADLNKRKLLTCAPNFYCANLNQGGLFNSKIARFAARLEEIPVNRNHTYGKDANILGRPLHYVPAITGGSSVTTSIRMTLNQNMVINEASSSYFTGLCQPGKALPIASNISTMAHPFNQHATPDTLGRTDFINQIGSCNSTLWDSYRHSSCPVIGADGNYEMFSSGTLPAGYFTRASNQNACGLEAIKKNTVLHTNSTLMSQYSPFKAIEAAPLNSQIILDRTLVQDACLRRAGAVCHTDLDCSPNKMHAAQAESYGLDFFGNEAEKSYYSEYLVCGQGKPKPLPSNTDEFKNYNMNLNRCCREVGSDLTTFTSDTPTSSAPGKYEAKTIGLKMSMVPGTAPNDPKRYSRLATVENVGSSTRPILSAYQERQGINVLAPNPNSAIGTNIKSPHQWKTLTEANSETCCGGGWIRKFADGSNDWTKRDRFNIDVTNFRCLNSRTPLISSLIDMVSDYNGISDVQSLVSQDYGDYCKTADNSRGACAQYTIKDQIQEIDPVVIDSYSKILINTVSPRYTSPNLDFYFMPKSADGNKEVVIDYGSSSRRSDIFIKLPSYVPRSFDNNINVRMINANGTYASGQCYSVDSTDPLEIACVNCCKYSFNSTNRTLRVTPDGTLAANFASFLTSRRVGIEFEVDAPGYNRLLRSKPGSSTYYLKRLGRLELSGIPQITHEALTCNDNINRLVPGIYKTGVNYLVDSLNPAKSFTAPENSFQHNSRYFTTSQGLQSDPVFSANDFKCCSPLGMTVSNQSLCCSGYATIEDKTNIKTCALPRGTNLMVYFNRFVSNEGIGADKPGGGLLETDFDNETGEPMLTASVNDKIRELGNKFCESGKVRQGGAFGNFVIEPIGSETDQTDKIYNIIDSTRDNAQNSNAGSTVAVGYNAFIEGFRWNHHLYCTEDND